MKPESVSRIGQDAGLIDAHAHHQNGHQNMLGDAQRNDRRNGAEGDAPGRHQHRDGRKRDLVQPQSQAVVIARSARATNGGLGGTIIFMETSRR